MFIVHPEPVVFLILLPMLQMDDHIDGAAGDDGADTVYRGDIDDAYAADLHEVAYHGRGFTDQCIGYAPDIDHIIRDESMTALDELQRGFTLAYAALADNQYTKIRRRHLQGDVEGTVQCLAVSYDIVTLFDAL